MKPVHAGENFFPGEIGRIDFGDGTVGAVIGHGRGALRGAGFQEVDADPLAAAQDRARIDAESAEPVDGGFRHIVLGQARDEGRLFAEISEGHGDIRLAAAEGHFQLGRLAEAQVTRRRQAQHNFSKGDDFHALRPCRS